VVKKLDELHLIERVTLALGFAWRLTENRRRNIRRDFRNFDAFRQRLIS
jgi:hypothetical protein